MAFVFSLIESGGRPAVLTRTLRMEGKSELPLYLYADLRPADRLPSGLRRTALIEAEHLPLRDPYLVQVGTFRFRLELGNLRVTFVALRPPKPTDDAQDPSSGRGPGGSTLNPLSIEADAFWADLAPALGDTTMGGLNDGVSSESGRPTTNPGTANTGTANTGTENTGTGDPQGGIEAGHTAATLGIRVVALPSEGGMRPVEQEELPEPGARFRLIPAQDPADLSLPRPVTFELTWHDEEAQTLGRVRTRAYRMLVRGTPEPPSNWIVPHMDHYLAEPFGDLYDWLYERLEKAGISPGGIALAFGIILGTSGLIFLAVQLDELAEAAEAERDAALASASSMKQATIASVSREDQCRAELADTARSLGNVEAADRLDAERSLGTTLAEVAWRRIRGEHDSGLEGPEARRARANRLLDLVRERKALREKEELPLASYRLKLPLASSLGQDLPRHILLWHSTPRLAEQLRLQVQTAGADFRGMWGISSRVVQEAAPADYRSSTTAALKHAMDEPAESPPTAALGTEASGTEQKAVDPKADSPALPTDQNGAAAASAIDTAPASPPRASAVPEARDAMVSPGLLRPGLTDVRDEPEWCAHQLGEGVRTVRKALLQADSGGLLPVYPEQLHLWSLALWHAYNHMPDLTFGRGPGLETCVTSLITDLAILRQEGGNRTAPILPDALDTLSSNAWTGGVLATTVLCPWREDRLVEGVRIALETIVDDWILREQETQERQGIGP